MPHIDFGRAFSNSETSSSASPASGTAGPDDLLSPDPDSPPHLQPARFRRSRLGRPDRTNIIFTVIAILGGLFCAFYFFNGADLLRVAGQWPRGFLYPNQESDDNATREFDPLADFLGLPAMPDAKKDSSHSGDPFSRISSLLALQPANRSLAGAPGQAASGLGAGFPGSPGISSPGLPAPGSLLSGLGLHAPGGDNLTGTLNNAAADLQRTAKNSAERTVRVVHDKVIRMEKRVVGRTKDTVRNTQRTVASAAGQTTPQGRHLQPSAATDVTSATSGTLGTSAGPATTATSAAQQNAGSTGPGIARATKGVGGMKNGGHGGLGRMDGGLGGLSGHAGGIGGHGGHGR